MMRANQMSSFLPKNRIHATCTRIKAADIPGTTLLPYWLNLISW